MAIGANIGGPTINFNNAPLPLPLTALEIGYGIDSNLTIHSGLHTTSLIFGNIQFDLGATYKLLNQKYFRPNISITPGINFASKIWRTSTQVDGTAKLWPTLDINAYWNYSKKAHYFYLGCNSYFELARESALNQTRKQHWLFSPQIGHVLKGKNNQWQFFTELKFIAPYLDNRFVFVDYKSIIKGRGSTGFYIGFRKLITNKRDRP